MRSRLSRWEVVIFHILIAEGDEIDQEGIPAGLNRPAPGLGQVAFRKIMVQFTEGHDFVLGPFFPGADARQGDQFLIGAGSGKVQGIETGFLAEVAVFIVGDDLRVVAFRRVNTGDVRFNVPGIQVFHNRNTLIALDDIVTRTMKSSRRRTERTG